MCWFSFSVRGGWKVFFKGVGKRGDAKSFDSEGVLILVLGDESEVYIA